MFISDLRQIIPIRKSGIRPILWLRDAKFGFRVHFGPQATGMSGDRYAKRMYEEGEIKPTL